jgi:hypothetical protein
MHTHSVWISNRLAGLSMERFLFSTSGYMLSSIANGACGIHELTQNRGIILKSCRLPLKWLGMFKGDFYGLVQEHPCIIRVAASQGKYTHASACEPDVALVQSIRKMARKRWSVQKREHAVAVYEVKTDEGFGEIRRRPVLEESRKCVRRCVFVIPEFPLESDRIRQ